MAELPSLPKRVREDGLQQCSKHPDQLLDLFCETCEEMICKDCILQVHRNHQYDLATDAFPKHKDVIVASLQPVEQQLASVNQALEGLDTESSLIAQQQKMIEREIEESIRQIHEALEARKKELIAQLDKTTEQKLTTLVTQQEQSREVYSKLTDYRNFVQNTLNTGSEAEILSLKKPVREQVSEMSTTIVPELFTPAEQADQQFAVDREAELTRALKQFGELCSCSHVLCPEKCRAEGSGLQVAMVGEAASATVHIVDQEGRECQRPVEVSCELVSSDGSSRVRGEVERTGESSHQISYRPQHSGRHQLHIRVEGKDISSSPFSVAVFTTTPTNVTPDLEYSQQEASISTVREGGRQ